MGPRLPTARTSVPGELTCRPSLRAHGPTPTGSRGEGCQPHQADISSGTAGTNGAGDLKPQPAQGRNEFTDGGADPRPRLPGTQGKDLPTTCSPPSSASRLTVCGHQPCHGHSPSTVRKRPHPSCGGEVDNGQSAGSSPGKAPGPGRVKLTEAVPCQLLPGARAGDGDEGRSPESRHVEDGADVR